MVVDHILQMGYIKILIFCMKKFGKDHIICKRSIKNCFIFTISKKYNLNKKNKDIQNLLNLNYYKAIKKFII